MCDDTTLNELLSLWQREAERGRDVPASELCRDRPDLAAEAERRIRALRQIKGLIGTTNAGISTSDFLNTDPPETDAAPRELPHIPGYEVLAKLGEGGMGVVYKAFDRKRRQMVALKTMRTVDPAALFRFKKEFRTLADVSHPNLVTLYELIADGAQWFFTMEFLEGTDFLTYVRSTSGRLRGAMRQLGEGVAALHSLGVLHRDLKPQNVLVTHEGRVLLLDFGLAAELDREGIYASTTQQLLGTIPYMSPEQGAGQPLSAASDWYSVGVILYEALTGRLPFAGSIPQILRNKDLYEPPPPKELVGDVPDDLSTLCADLLRRQVERRPDAAEVVSRLGGVTVAKVAASVLRPPKAESISLVGRERHVQTLSDAFAEVRQGRTVAVHVAGRSGAGKSALIRKFLDTVNDGDGTVVLSGQCYEQESVPFKAFDNLIDGLSRYLGRLPDTELQAVLPRDLFSLTRVFPVLRRLHGPLNTPRLAEAPDPQEVRRRAFASLRELLARLGDRRALVLCIDDLQWGDADSAALLADLLRPPDPPVLLFVGSYRDEESEASPFLAAWARARETLGELVAQRELEVDALTQTEAHELALRLLGQNHAEVHACAEAVVRESGGNPFFVIELVRHVQGEDDTSGRAILGAGVSLDQAVWSRVQRLPEGPRNLLTAVAVAGRPLRQEEALRATDLGTDSLSALTLLRTSHLIRNVASAGEGLLATYHDRVRESVLAHLAAEEIRRTHHRLAVVLEATGQADPELLAVHFLGAGQSALAGKYLILAADRAGGALAFDRAARLYRESLQLCTFNKEEEKSLRVKLADALANAGRGAEAAREYLTAAGDAKSIEALELQQRAALHYLTGGHLSEGLATLRNVLGAVGMKLPKTPRRALWSLLLRRIQLYLRGLRFVERDARQVSAADLLRIDVCWSASTGLMVNDYILGACFQTRGLLLALRAGEVTRIVRALAIEATHVSTGGGFSHRRTRKLIDGVDLLAKKLSHPYNLGMVSLAQGLAAYLEGRWKDAGAFCDHAENIFRAQCTGVAWELDTVQTFGLWSLTYRGEVAELSRRWPVLLKEAQLRGDLYAVTNFSTYIMSVVRLATDEPEAAADEVARAMERWPQEGFHVQHHNALLARTLIALYQGNGVTACNDITEHLQAYRHSLLINVQQVRIDVRQLHARCALVSASGAVNPGPFLRLAKRNAHLLEREKMPWADALALLIRSGIAACSRDLALAKILLADAATRLDAVDMRLCAAAARSRLGRLISGAGGRALVDQAEAWMAGQQIRNPTRLIAIYAPGFPD